MKREELLQGAKPILFNTEMVQAILDGRKTVTRRIIKEDTTGLYPGKCILGAGMFSDETNMRRVIPKYKVGDILYIRETWMCWRAHRYEANADIMFKAGGEGIRLQFANGSTDSVNRYDYDTFVNKWFSRTWKPSIHMPKEAARIFLRIKNVRAERLQDITTEEIRREGLTSMAVHAGDKEIAYKEWKLLWDSTISKTDLNRYGWDANPYVWVYEFERVEAE